MRRVTLLLFFSVLAAGRAEAGVLFTSTQNSACHDYSKADFGHWVCPGPGGRAVGFSDDCNIASVAIGPPVARTERAQERL